MNAFGTEISGEELYLELVKANKSLLDKEKELISIRHKVENLENMINSRVDDILQSLNTTHSDLESRLLEVLDIISRKDIYSRDKTQLYGDKEKPFSGYATRSQQNRSNLEEDKYQSHHQTAFKRNPNFSLSTKPSKQPSAFQSKPTEKDNKIEDFEDDDFKFNLSKTLHPQFTAPPQRNMDRQRAVSSSVYENREYLLNHPPREHNPYKRFKQNEGLGNEGAFVNPLLPQFVASVPPPSLPFLPNLQIDPEMICQMLIRKLAANSGLTNINDICRILPDTLLKRARSNTD